MHGRVVGDVGVIVNATCWGKETSAGPSTVGRACNTCSCPCGACDSESAAGHGGCLGLGLGIVPLVLRVLRPVLALLVLQEGGIEPSSSRRSRPFAATGK